MPEMEVDSVRSSDPSPVVLLMEKGGSRILPIWIGILEAGAIAVKLEEIEVKRPLAQDLLHSIISDLGGRVLYVIIDDVVDNVFYAKIVLSKDGHFLGLY